MSGGAGILPSWRVKCWKIRDDSHFHFPLASHLELTGIMKIPSDSLVDFVKGDITKEFSLIFRDECLAGKIPWFKFPTFSGLKQPIFFQQSCRCCATDSSDWPAFVAGMGLRLSVPFFWPISFVWTPPWQPSTLGVTGKVGLVLRHLSDHGRSIGNFLPYWNRSSIGISGFLAVDFKVPSWFSWGYSLGNVLETGWSYSTISIKITLQRYINSV